MLSMGHLCKILKGSIQDEISVPFEYDCRWHISSPTQQNVLHAILALVYPENQLQTLQKPSSKTASLIFRNLIDINPDLVKLARNENALQTIQKNFETYFVLKSHMSDSQLHQLLLKIQLEIRDTANDQLPVMLRNYPHNM